MNGPCLGHEQCGSQCSLVSSETRVKEVYQVVRVHGVRPGGGTQTPGPEILQLCLVDKLFLLISVHLVMCVVECRVDDNDSGVAGAEFAQCQSSEVLCPGAEMRLEC